MIDTGPDYYLPLRYSRALLVAYYLVPTTISMSQASVAFWLALPPLCLRWLTGLSEFGSPKNTAMVVGLIQLMVALARSREKNRLPYLHHMLAVVHAAVLNCSWLCSRLFVLDHYSRPSD